MRWCIIVMRRPRVVSQQILSFLKHYNTQTTYNTIWYSLVTCWKEFIIHDTTIKENNMTFIFDLIFSVIAHLWHAISIGRLLPGRKRISKFHLQLWCLPFCLDSQKDLFHTLQRGAIFPWNWAFLLTKRSLKIVFTDPSDISTRSVRSRIVNQRFCSTNSLILLTCILSVDVSRPSCKILYNS